MVPRGGIPQFVFQGWLQHPDFKDADAPSWAAEATPKVAWKASERSAKFLVHSVEWTIDRWNQPGSEAMGAVGIEMDFEDVGPAR